jgi:hypothetical protein
VALNEFAGNFLKSTFIIYKAIIILLKRLCIDFQPSGPTLSPLTLPDRPLLPPPPPVERRTA